MNCLADSVGSFVGVIQYQTTAHPIIPLTDDTVEKFQEPEAVIGQCI